MAHVPYLNTDPFICECGTHTTMGNRTKHKRTKKHLSFINQLPITETCICGSIIMTQSKKFHILSIEHLTFIYGTKKLIKCDCGSVINPYTRNEHNKTAKHKLYELHGTYIYKCKCKSEDAYDCECDIDRTDEEFNDDGLSSYI